MYDCTQDDVDTVLGEEGELLWTDPQSLPGRGPSKRVSLFYFSLTGVVFPLDRSSDRVCCVLLGPVGCWNCVWT